MGHLPLKSPLVLKGLREPVVEEVVDESPPAVRDPDPERGSVLDVVEGDAHACPPVLLLPQVVRGLAPEPEEPEREVQVVRGGRRGVLAEAPAALEPGQGDHQIVAEVVPRHAHPPGPAARPVHPR